VRQRIWVLTSYFVRTFLRSITGVGFVLGTLAYWLVFFNPQQQTPDATYYVLLIGIFGGGLSFLVTIVIASKANQAELFPWIVRLPSRVEFMTAVFFSTLIITLLLQTLLAVLALIRGPSLTAVQLIEIPPIWLSLIILAGVLALHATDLVARGWSRIYVFGILAILLFAQGIRNATLNNVLTRLNRVAANQGWTNLNGIISNYAINLNNSDGNFLNRLFSLVFWPFQAMAEAVASGEFTTAQALAPAILLLYATILFMLAADLLANKDLTFME